MRTISKIQLLIIFALFSFNKKVYAQQVTEIGWYLAPARVFPTIKSRDGKFDEYVNDRNKTDPKRGGIVLGLTLEIALFKNLQFQTGISIAFYGMDQVRLNATDLQKLENPDRVSYIPRQENEFINIPLNIKNNIFKLPIKPTKHVESAEFAIFAIGGVIGSYMFRANYERKYELQSGSTEITENEFENSFDTNPFNIALEAGLGFQFSINQKWRIFLQPTINYQIFSIYKNAITEIFTVFSTRMGVMVRL